jgi:NADH-quinone oxidoreductase subunit G
MAKITLDSRTYEVPVGDNLLRACLSLGLDLPYFCWHPALGSVGACRQCAVVQYRDDRDTRGRLVMACMTPVTDGLRAALDAPEAREFRAGVIECLMTNHPHDCPVCEEGGECHLQDMTLMTGHTLRRYRGLKRTHRNQYLGPFVSHEMNRCIACYRCVRYYRDYAGGRDLQVFALRNDVYFGRFEDGVLDSEFSGNLVEVCPTGVFTDRPFGAHYVRKWDLQQAPSVCVHCAVGCNTSPGERYGTLRRIVDRYNGAVNGYFLCDRGRFGYGFVNGEGRVRQPLFRGQPVSAETALVWLIDSVRRGAIGIGSPRATLEANFALRELVGPENFYAGFARAEAEALAAVLDVLRHWPVRVPSLREVAQADAVLVLGEDVPNTAPLLALALRQAVRSRAFEIADRAGIPRWQDQAVREASRGENSPLFIATPAATRLDDVAASDYRAAPENIARLGFAVASLLDPAAPGVADLPEREAHIADLIAETLAAARRPLVVSGTGSGSLAVIEAAANVARALARRRGGTAVDLCYAVPECNSLGLAMLDGRSVEDVFAAAERDDCAAVVVLENDLYRRAEPAAVDRFLGGPLRLAAIDHSRHATLARAELILPAATFAETEGTLVNLEGRAQRFFSVMVPRAEARDGWLWLAEALNRGWSNLDAVTAACAEAFPELAGILSAAPNARFRRNGGKIPRESHRYSGRTAMHADRRIHEPKPPDDLDSPLAYSMEGVGVDTGDDLPPAAIPFFWAPRWNSGQQAMNRFMDEPGGHLRGGDPGVRLIETPAVPAPRWFDGIPDPPRRDAGWRTVPLHHVFGSEELSVWSEPLAERVPAPYAALHPEDAAALGLDETVAIEAGNRRWVLPLVREPSLPLGTVGIPVGIPGLAMGVLPEWVRVAKGGGEPFPTDFAARGGRP